MNRILCVTEQYRRTALKNVSGNDWPKPSLFDRTVEIVPSVIPVWILRIEISTL